MGMTEKRKRFVGDEVALFYWFIADCRYFSVSLVYFPPEIKDNRWKKEKVVDNWYFFSLQASKSGS